MYAMIGCLAGILAATSGTLYIFSIFSGKTRPNKATWLIWAVIDGIMLESYFRLGARETIFVPCVLFARAMIIAILLLWFNKSRCKLTFFDKVCIGGAAISLISRLGFKDPFVTLLITLVIMAIGAVPTVRKIYIDCGRNENKAAWCFLVVSFIVNLFAVNYAGRNFLEIVIYPAGIFCIDAVIMFFLFLPYFKGRRVHS
ncbi:MAG: hypothetical protein AAB397_04290 [Patescibacteria group bacterium]